MNYHKEARDPIYHIGLGRRELKHSEHVRVEAAEKLVKVSTSMISGTYTMVPGVDVQVGEGLLRSKRRKGLPPSMVKMAKITFSTSGLRTDDVRIDRPLLALLVDSLSTSGSSTRTRLKRHGVRRVEVYLKTSIGTRPVLDVEF